MQNSKPYYDLCIPYNENYEELCTILDELFTCGFRTIAIDQIFDHSKYVKRPSDRGGDIFPVPMSLDLLKTKYIKKLLILNRITIVYECGNGITSLMKNSLNLKKYDLIAGAPLDTSSIQHCCSIFVGDIFAMYLSDEHDSNLIQIPRKFYSIAIGRGLFFEVKYSPCITSSTARKRIMSTARNYKDNRNAENVIITSACKKMFHVRTPQDISNLGIIFGFNEEQSRGAISNVCRKLLLNAEARRMGNTVMFINSISSRSSSESSNDDKDQEDSANENRPIKKKKLS